MKEGILRKLHGIERTIIMDAPVQKVWKVIATTEGLDVWFMPNDFQPVKGHEFTFISQSRGEWDGIVHCRVMGLVHTGWSQEHVKIRDTMYDGWGRTACKCRLNYLS